MRERHVTVIGCGFLSMRSLLNSWLNRLCRHTHMQTSSSCVYHRSVECVTAFIASLDLHLQSHSCQKMQICSNIDAACARVTKHKWLFKCLELKSKNKANKKKKKKEKNKKCIKMPSRVFKTIHCLLVDVSYMWRLKNIHTKRKKSHVCILASVGQQKCADAICPVFFFFVSALEQFKKKKKKNETRSSWNNKIDEQKKKNTRVGAYFVKHRWRLFFFLCLPWWKQKWGVRL